MPRSSQKSGRRKQTLHQRLIVWMFRPTRLFAVATLLIAWLCWPILKGQLPDLEEREEYRVTAAQVTVTPPPRWVPENVAEKVFERAGFEEPLSLLDPRLNEKMAVAFHTWPWVEQLVQVRRTWPAGVFVEVVYRRPVAMVEVVGRGYLPVDRHGHLLPEKDFSPADIDRYPLIGRVTTIPTGYQGDSWGDPAVTGAAQLAALLTEEHDGRTLWQSFQLKRILAPRRLSVASEPDQLQFEIETNGGSRIVWGRPPETRHPGELSVEKKIARLAEYQRQYDGFDSGPAAVSIDIRDWQGTRRSLLATEDQPPRH